MALYSIKNERALCDQIVMNGGFRWFVGLGWDDKVFDHSTLSRNRERLFGSGAAEALFGEVVRPAPALQQPSGGGRHADQGVGEHEELQRDEAPQPDARHSTSDPDAKLLRKGKGQESMLCHLGHVLVDAVSGLVKACRVTKACDMEGNSPAPT